MSGHRDLNPGPLAPHARIKAGIALRIGERDQAGLPTPGLATILIGDDPASKIYVHNKIRTCEKLGMQGVSEGYSRTTIILNFLGNSKKNPYVFFETFFNIFFFSTFSLHFLLQNLKES